MHTETVVLLHGLGRTPLAMAGLEKYLSRQGFQVVNQGYPSRQHSIPELCRQLMHDLMPQLTAAHRIHFVTHSMGGILLRYSLQYWQLPRQRLGRAVMLAPPNQGSEVVDHLRRFPFIPRFMGPAFLQLGTDADSVPSQLLQRENDRLAMEVGVIAGRRTLEPWFTPWLGGENDGKVSVARSRHPAMKDFCVMDVGHTFIMNDPAVRQQIVQFLRHGMFVHQDDVI